MTSIMFVCVVAALFSFFLMYFSMVFTRGSCSRGLERQGSSDDEIRRIISVGVVVTVPEAIPEVFGSIKTMMIEMFDERYVVVIEVVVAATTATVIAARPHRVIQCSTRSSKTRNPRVQCCPGPNCSHEVDC